MADLNPIQSLLLRVFMFERACVSVYARVRACACAKLNSTIYFSRVISLMVIAIITITIIIGW